MARNRFSTGTALDSTQLNRSLDVNYKNLVRNGDFEAWSTGASSPPDYWSATANGGTIERSSSAGTYHSGTYGLHIVQTSAGAGDTLLKFPAWSRYGIGFQSRKVTASVWVKCAAVSTAVLRIDDGVSTAEATHTGGGGWERLTAQLDVSASATKLDVILEVNKPGAGSAEAWFDQAQLVIGESEGEWGEAPEDRCADATEYDSNGTDAYIRAPKIVTGARTTTLTGGAATESVTYDLPRGVYTPYCAIVTLRGTLSTVKLATVVTVTATQLTVRYQTADGTNITASESVSIYYMVFGSGAADPTDQF